MDQIEQVLARLDSATAERVRPVVESLVGVGEDRVPLSSLNQLDLEHFLWHRLPAAWPTASVEDHEIAWALGDFLEAAGLERYAAICRDRRTHEILAAWHTDPAEGERLSLESQQASGVLPPETSVLTFGEAMGHEEARTMARVSGVLEEAITEGGLDPAARGFRTRAVELVEAYLSTPSTAYDGEPPVSVVRKERTALWAHTLNPRARPFWAGALAELEAEPTVPANLELSLTPAAAMLDAVGDGVTLTPAGYLPPKVALVLNERFGWVDQHAVTRPRGEADIVLLLFLRDHLAEQRLLTTRGNRVTVSAEGRRCLADPRRLWRAVTGPGPRWRPGFEQDALAVTAALLVLSDGLTRRRLQEEVASILAGKWRSSTGGSLDDAVQRIQLEWHRVAMVMGWNRGRLGTPSHRLSSFGRAAATSLFWAAAAKPTVRDSVG